MSKRRMCSGHRKGSGIKMKALILRGLGIECELEMRRAFEKADVFESVEWLTLSDFFQSNGQAQSSLNLNKGDWVGIPGGFSYSDHFGSGRLLSLQLQEAKFFEQIEAAGAHVLGVCNGFQILCQAGVFGTSTRLEANQQRSFVNRWTSLELADSGANDVANDKVDKVTTPQKAQWHFPVRHGEGNLQFDELPSQVKRFLVYADDFDNGSKERTAGLTGKRGESLYVGLMPHPEVALKRFDEPDRFGTDHFSHHRDRINSEAGDGLQFLQSLFKKGLSL